MDERLKDVTASMHAHLDQMKAAKEHLARLAREVREGYGNEALSEYAREIGVGELYLRALGAAEHPSKVEEDYSSASSVYVADEKEAERIAAKLREDGFVAEPEHEWSVVTEEEFEDAGEGEDPSSG